MEPTNQKNGTTEIDLREIFRELGSNFFLILIAALIGFAAAFLITKTLITPEYSSTTKLYVMASEQDQSTSNVNSQELQAGALLTKDYEQIIESREVTETVIANLQLKEGSETMTHEQLLSKMSITTPTDTRVVSITISDPDPYRAHDIAEAVCEVAENRIQEVMDMKTVKVVETANIPTSPDSPSTARNCVIGFILGLLIAVIYVIASSLGNNTIRTTEDIEQYLNLSTLAVIPLSKDSRKGRRMAGRKQKAAKRGRTRR